MIFVRSGCQTTGSKPEPDIYLCACEKIGTKPKEAYAIEDSYHGIRAADAAGMKPIMVPDLTAPDAEMWRLSTHIFSSLFEVLEFLKKPLQLQ